tara:strand:+ start:2389 stop:2631 length:243 start_codon:yes stop_codon:yes gene_type:complete
MADNEELERLIVRLEAGKESHPNLCGLWLSYLKLKKDAYEKALLQADSAINTMYEGPDPENDMLIALFAVARIMRDRNTT